MKNLALNRIQFLIIFLVQTSNKNSNSGRKFPRASCEYQQFSLQSVPESRFRSRYAASSATINFFVSWRKHQSRSLQVQYLLINRLDRILAPIEPIWKRGRTRASFESDFESHLTSVTSWKVQHNRMHNRMPRL